MLIVITYLILVVIGLALKQTKMDVLQKIAEWGEKREGDSFATAEKLVKPWRTLLNPLDAAGERSYTFLGRDSIFIPSPKNAMILGPLANLERALLSYAFERMLALGFRPVYVSDLVTRHVTSGCGLMQRSEQGIQVKFMSFCKAVKQFISM